MLFDKGYEAVVLSEFYGSPDYYINYFYESEREMFHLLQIIIETCIFQSNKNVCIFSYNLSVYLT
jgi:hypothetical protein